MTKKIIHMKNSFFLHHCFKTFEALPKVVPRMFLSFRSKSSKAAKLFFEIGFLGIFLENTCDGVCYQKIVRLTRCEFQTRQYLDRDIQFQLLLEIYIDLVLSWLSEFS